MSSTVSVQREVAVKGVCEDVVDGWMGWMGWMKKRRTTDHDHNRNLIVSAPTDSLSTPHARHDATL